MDNVAINHAEFTLDDDGYFYKDEENKFAEGIYLTIYEEELITINPMGFWVVLRVAIYIGLVGQLQNISVTSIMGILVCSAEQLKKSPFIFTENVIDCKSGQEEIKWE